MNQEQYTRTKGETIIVVENPIRDLSYDPVSRIWEPRPYFRPWRSRPYWYRPYYNGWTPYWTPHSRSPWHGFKVAVITLIAAPIVVVELALLLDYLRLH
jgi:hypothetical protein